MSMKVEIDIVTGFLGSGKTSFINALIKNTLVSKEKILVIQCEKGEKNINQEIFSNSQITIKQYECTKPLTENYIKNIINLHSPHRVIIEYNGTRKLNEFLNVLDEKSLKKLCYVSTIFNISDATTFDLFLNNMGGIIVPAIYNCNLAIINNSGMISKEELDRIKIKIESLNQKTYILEVKDIKNLESTLNSEKILNNGLLKKFRILLKSNTLTNLLY